MRWLHSADEVCLQTVALSKCEFRRLFGAGSPYLDPPGATQSETLRDDIEGENERPERNTTGRFEISHIDASLDTTGFAAFILYKLLRSVLVVFLRSAVSFSVWGCFIFVFCLILSTVIFLHSLIKSVRG